MSIISIVVADVLAYAVWIFGLIFQVYSPIRSASVFRHYSYLKGLFIYFIFRSSYIGIRGKRKVYALQPNTSSLVYRLFPVCFLLFHAGLGVGERVLKSHAGSNFDRRSLFFN